MSRSRWPGRAIGAAALAVVVTSPPLGACTLIQPEVGDRLTACSDADSDPATPVDFKTQIRPLLDGERPPTVGCKGCHDPEGGTRAGFIETGFATTTLERLRAGGRETGANVIVPRSPCNSIIIQKVRGTFRGARMPKAGPYWEPQQVQLLMDWIAEGANGANDL